MTAASRQTPADVSLVDYGVGNIRAFANMFNRLDISADIASTPAQLTAARRLVLPGVGAFDWAMAKLNASGLRDILDERVQSAKVPVLGVCVGMQMMAARSEEGRLPGLGWIDAVVERLGSGGTAELPLPHMGWNDVAASRPTSLFNGLDALRYYFLHSYVVVPRHAADILATTHYCTAFASAVNRGHVYGVQFHPEKSHHWGAGLLKNFAEL